MDFYEDDEPLADVIDSFDRGRRFTTNPATTDAHGWFCQHYALTASHSLGQPTVGCGCQMQPLVTP